MAPIIEKVVSERDNIHLNKIDADQDHNEDIMIQFDVMSIPTLVLIDESNKVLGTLVGQVSERDLNNWIDNATGVLDN